MDEQHEITDENTATDTDTKTVKYTGHAPDKPILKDAKTGKFIAGTGSSGKGGRKKGSRDRVSQAMVDLATELVADRGRELFHEMADRDPAQALALVSKIISPEELRAVYAEERQEEKNQPQEVRINLVSSGSPRLSDSRTQGQIEDQQRGLNSPVERIKHEPEAATDVVADQVAAEVDEAAEAEKERVARQNEAIRAHGGLTGVPSRASRTSDAIEYPDEDTFL